MLLAIVRFLLIVHILTLNDGVYANWKHLCENLSKQFHIHNTSLPTFLLDPSGDQTYVCSDDAVSLTCCMTGYSNIEWQVYTLEYHSLFRSWLPLTWDRNGSYHLDKNNQTLIINHANQSHDQKYYKCIGYGIRDYQEIESVMKLRVEDCSKFDRPIFLLPNEPMSTKPVVPGDRVILKCSLFALNDSLGGHLHWYRMKMSSNSTTLDYGQISTDGRFLEISQRDPGSHVENSYLFINITEPDDFKWYYVCYTTLSDVANGQRRIQLTVKERRDEHIVHLVVLIIIAMTTVAMATAVLMYRFRVEICLFYKTKIQKSRRREDVEYHIFLLHSNESHDDRSFARDVVRPFLLNELKYRVFSEADFTLGQDYLDHCATGLEHSHVMVVIVSRQLLADETCRILIRDALSSGNRIIYIIREPVSNDTESAQDILDALRIGRKVKWLREDDQEVQTAECKFLCSLQPEHQPCRETDSIDYCRTKLRLYLLQFLEDSSAVGSWVLWNGSPSINVNEQDPIVSTDFMSQNC